MAEGNERRSPGFPKTPNRSTRRNFLKAAGTGLAGASLLGIAGCGGGAGTSGASAGDGMWKQFSGMTLAFISENTAPTSAIAANLQPFK
ncbi:MAG: hypothetical protein M3514_04155, partial [Actinomycetota bacterium]|nr:hypothetical protein [Actinomycetota bacterium]